MASVQIEVAASSSPFSYISFRDHKRSANVMGYNINSQCVHKNKADDQDQDQDEDSSWLPSQNLETDDSWLPTFSHNSTVTSESKGSRHEKVENNIDDSWLPAVGDSNGKYGTDTNESENDIDYSWLPSTFIDNAKNKDKSGNINKNTTKTKKNNRNNNSNSNSCLQMKSRNDHWALAGKVVFCDQQNQNVANLKKTTESSCSRQQDSPSKSRYVVESPTSGGVSSLLQRWKDLAEDKNSNNAKNSPSSNDNGSGSTCKDNKNDITSCSSPTDSDANLESDKASLLRQFSCPLPSRDSKNLNSGGADKEKIRVVDIIKKLSREEELAASNAAGHGNQSLAPIRTNLHPKQIEREHKGVTGVKISRHLIRGRHAIKTFLMQMEHDKHRELKRLVEHRAVSNFKHRGRIQSLLRFKILRLGVEPKPEDKIHRGRVSKALESNKRLDVLDIRERFNSGIGKGTFEPRKHKRNEESQTTSSTSTREVEIKTKTTTCNKKQEQQPKPEPMTPNQSTNILTTSCKVAVHKAKFVDSNSSLIMPKEDRHYKDDSYSSPITPKEDRHYKDDNDNNEYFYDDEGPFMSAKTSYGQMADKNRRMQALESFKDWMTSEYSQTHSDLDEDESYDMQLFDTDYDWISHISRPKSDWEDMRQVRYQEMLHEHSLANGDIQRLLERKNVSSFLGSSLRNLIDQLMVSRIQQSHAQDLVVRKKEVSTEEIEREDSSVVEEDRRSRTETKCSEYSEYVDQTSYLGRSWRPNDVVINSETTITTSPSDTTTTTFPTIEQSFSSNRSHNNGTPRSSPAIAHQTIEMELIYELRGHMEQLHHEITDLRKSIKSCVNMQVKLQHSFKQNVAAAATHSDQRKERKPPGIGKHNCSVCYDAQVDSLLYRCGHMCTCFKCALELQRTSEECPVCEAPIVDVVKAMCS